MLTKIILSQVASYKSPAIVETDKKINLIYGLNGTGKSTFSNYLMNHSHIRFKGCSVEGLSDDHELMVYSQDFVRDNFFEPEGLKGIFTLSKTNKDAETKIENAKVEIDKLRTELTEKQNELKLERETISEKITASQNVAWKVRTDYSGGDRILEFCLDNLKNSKEKLFNYLATIPKPVTEPPKSVKDLKNELESISGDNSKKYSNLPSIDCRLAYIESDALFEKQIIGNDSSTVSDLITELGNSDWVKDGLEYLSHKDSQENESCPFCQEKTISKLLIKNIEDYFDKSYENDKNLLQSLLSDYCQVRQSILRKNLFETNPKYEIYKKDFEINYEKFTKILDENIKIIEDKIKSPSRPLFLKSSSETLGALNEIIRNINILVTEHNQKIDEKGAIATNIKKDFWSVMRWNYDQTISAHNIEKTNSAKKIHAISNSTKALETDIRVQQDIIRVQQAQTVNIDEAIENINNGLTDLSITDFKIKKYSENRYKIIRDEADNGVFHSLSEGEKMIISFIYFIELCRGKKEATEVSKKKVIVIDDPMSSLSHIYVFNIGRLIKNEFFGVSKKNIDKQTKEESFHMDSPYEQVFILTHSLYFFYEMTETNHKIRSHTQNLFRLIKNERGSRFQSMKYESIQNEYQAYWYIIRDDSQPPALIANCMRNIIEYFFNFVEKKDLNNFFQQEPLRSNRYLAFNRYINRESHSLGQNIFDYKEFDYEEFKSAFQELFKLANYEEHYNKMMGTK